MKLIERFVFLKYDKQKVNNIKHTHFNKLSPN